jgi:hypothetical protein
VWGSGPAAVMRLMMACLGFLLADAGGADPTRDCPGLVLGSPASPAMPGEALGS